MPRSNKYFEALAPHLDPGIRHVVGVLMSAGIETFESCEGSPGHAYPEPTVRFHGERAQGFRALATLQEVGVQVTALRRTWPINDGEPTGPWWEIVVRIPTTIPSGDQLSSEQRLQSGRPPVPGV